MYQFQQKYLNSPRINFRTEMNFWGYKQWLPFFLLHAKKNCVSNNDDVKKNIKSISANQWHGTQIKQLEQNEKKTNRVTLNYARS